MRRVDSASEPTDDVDKSAAFMRLESGRQASFVRAGIIFELMVECQRGGSRWTITSNRRDETYFTRFDSVIYDTVKRAVNLREH
jgi:hypothetical protein